LANIQWHRKKAKLKAGRRERRELGLMNGFAKIKTIKRHTEMKATIRRQQQQLTVT
jgi:hypothetical protein